MYFFSEERRSISVNNWHSHFLKYNHTFWLHPAYRGTTGRYLGKGTTFCDKGRVRSQSLI